MGRDLNTKKKILDVFDEEKRIELGVLKVKVKKHDSETNQHQMKIEDYASELMRLHYKDQSLTEGKASALKDLGEAQVKLAMQRQDINDLMKDKDRLTAQNEQLETDLKAL